MNDYVRAFSDKMQEVPICKVSAAQVAAIQICMDAIVARADRHPVEALLNAFFYEIFFAEELHARNLRPFAAAEAAELINLAKFEGPALAHAADEWSRQLADPASQLYATLFDLQSLDVVRIIEGRT